MVLVNHGRSSTWPEYNSGSGGCSGTGYRNGELLPTLYFYGIETEVGGTFRAVVYIIRVHNVGFMVVFPRVKKGDIYLSSAE